MGGVSIFNYLKLTGDDGENPYTYGDIIPVQMVIMVDVYNANSFSFECFLGGRGLGWEDIEMTNPPDGAGLFTIGAIREQAGTHNRFMSDQVSFANLQISRPTKDELRMHQIGFYKTAYVGELNASENGL